MTAYSPANATSCSRVNFLSTSSPSQPSLTRDALGPGGSRGRSCQTSGGLCGVPRTARRPRCRSPSGTLGSSQCQLPGGRSHPHKAFHTNPSTTDRHFPPCRTTHTRSQQNSPRDSCKAFPQSCTSDGSRSQSRSYRTHNSYSPDSSPDSAKSCPPQGNRFPLNPPRAATSHSASVGKRYPLTVQSHVTALLAPVRTTLPLTL